MVFPKRRTFRNGLTSHVTKIVHDKDSKNTKFLTET